MPAALFLGTPAADLTKTGDSVYLNAEVDNTLGRYEGRIEACLKLYANGRDLKEPLLSPVYGDLSGWPPTVLITGTRDLLLSPTVRTHRKLRAAGVAAELHVYEGQSHADYLTAFPAPEARDALKEVASFFDRHWRR
jgi:acetyl esterase/lipase